MADKDRDGTEIESAGARPDLSRLEVEQLPLDKLIPNAWNPNAMDDAAFSRLTQELSTVGMIDPIQVVEMADGTYRILGGEHRFHAASVLGWTSLPCVVLRGARWQDEDMQKLVTVRLNALKGRINATKMVQLYNEMAEKYGEEDVQNLFAYCLREGTLIETEMGVRPIEGVRVGERVLAGDGVFRPVVSKVDEYVETDMLEFVVERIPVPLHCTAGHHMFGRKRDWAASKIQRHRVWGPTVELRAEELEVGDALEIPPLQPDIGIPILRIPAEALEVMVSRGGRSAKQIPYEYLVTEDLAWLLGLYAADGSYCERDGTITFTLGGDEAVLRDRVEAVAWSIFGITGTRSTGSRDNVLLLRLYSRALGRTLAAWCGHGAVNKRLPAAVLQSAGPVLKAALDGVFDGDGALCDGRRTVGVVSATLSHQVARIVVSLGGRFSAGCYEYERDDGFIRQPRWQVSWLEPFDQGSVGDSGVLLAEIREISVVPYKGRILDLGLEGEHSYLAGLVRVGNTDQNAWEALLKDIGKGLRRAGLPKKVADQFDQATQGAKTVDDLGRVLNELFAQNGNTLSQSYMVFSWGGHEHLYVILNKKMKKHMDKVVKYCRETGRDMAELLEPLTATFASNLQNLGLPMPGAEPEEFTEAEVDAIAAEVDAPDAVS
jgi:hypothetical protein